MSDSSGQIADRFQFLRLLQLPFHIFHFSDIGGDLEANGSTVRPFNGPVMVDVPAAVDGIFVLPDDDPGRIAVFIEKLIVRAVWARRFLVSESGITYPPGQIPAECLLHRLVHE